MHNRFWDEFVIAFIVISGRKLLSLPKKKLFVTNDACQLALSSNSRKNYSAKSNRTMVPPSETTESTHIQLQMCLF
jgi:hypothetical protein